MAKAKEKSQTFEQTLKELENIVSQLEVGNLTLDNALTEFEKGVKLAKQAQTQLKKAEQRIQILLSENSNTDLTEFDVESK